MNKKLYIYLLEAERERLLDRVREKEREIEDLRDKLDPIRGPIRSAMRDMSEKMARELFDNPNPFGGIQSILTKEEHDKESIQPHQGSQEE